MLGMEPGAPLLSDTPLYSFMDLFALQVIHRKH